MKILIQNGRVIDPASGRDETADVAIAAGRIVGIGKVGPDFAANRVIDASGCVVAPGLVDLCARLREPGLEYEGMLESELNAAAAGGVTSLVCPPDTDPALDEPGLVEMLKFRARKLSLARLFPLGALTKGLKGESLTEMVELTEAGCVGFGQAEAPIRDTVVLSRAMQYAATHGFSVWLRPQEPWLGKGVAASGSLATRMGLSGVPVTAETIALHTIFELVRSTGARVHLCRLSSAAGVALVRAAKAEGLAVTADVSINSLHLTDVDIGYFNPAMRLTPPLRQGRDRDALRAGLADGTIDTLVSDHMPVDADEKNRPFAEAEPGATGLELLLSLALRWGQDLGLSLPTTLARVTSDPVRVMGDALGSLVSSAGRLVEGGVADVCVFDAGTEWTVTPEALRSQGKSTPFAYADTGMALPGRVRATVVAGVLATGLSAARRALTMRLLRCLWRLLRVSVHLLHGLAIVLRRFEAMAPAARAEAIRWWSRKLLALIGVSLDAQGAVPPGARLIAANHISWLDIAAIHAVCPQARFVSKADVHHWPVIGRLVAGAGTLFIERERKRDALRVVHHAAEAMRAGEVVAIFPEGTTGAGHALLPFHANLFQAAISAQVPVQPVLLRFSEPGHAVSPAAAFIGETTLLESVWQLLSAQGVTAHVTVLDAVPVEGLDRRAVSEAVEARLAAPLAAAQDNATPAATR